MFPPLHSSKSRHLVDEKYNDFNYWKHSPAHNNNNNNNAQMEFDF